MIINIDTKKIKETICLHFESEIKKVNEHKDLDVVSGKYASEVIDRFQKNKIKELNTVKDIERIFGLLPFLTENT